MRTQARDNDALGNAVGATTTLFEPGFLAACESVFRFSQRTLGRRYLGRTPDRRLAAGTDVTGVCDYATGHELRYIDWNRCARLDELTSKQFHGSELESVYVLLDATASMRIGTPPKFDFARRLAATLGYVALANGDRLEVVAVADGLAARTGPLARSRSDLPRLLSFLDGLDCGRQTTSLATAAAAFARGTTRPGVVVLISDLFDPAATGFSQAMEALQRVRCRPFVVQTYDPFDADPGTTGWLRLTDAESGATLTVSIDERDRQNYRAVFQEFCDSVRRFCFRCRVGIHQTATSTPLGECVESILRAATFRPLAIPPQPVTA